MILHYSYGLPNIPSQYATYYIKANQFTIGARVPEKVVLTEPPKIQPVITVATVKKIIPPPPAPPPPPPKPQLISKIHFAFNSYYVPFRNRLELKKLPKDKQYILIGGADRVGTYRYNMWLSNKRALEVKYFMEKDGFHVIKTKGVGYTECHAPDIPMRRCRVVKIYSK